MKALVTGANGFVGSNLVRHLLDLGHNVTALTRNGQSLQTHKNLIVAKGDITNPTSLVSAFKNHEIVFHLAGTVGYSKALHQSMVLNNVIGTANVIEACKLAQVPKLFYMSSVVAIGAGFTSNMVLSETSPFNIHHLNLGYFETKHRAEILALEAHEKGDVEVFMGNPSTIYGPGDAQKGSRKTQLKVAQGKMHFYTGGGVGIIHIDDVLNSCLKIIELGRSGERFVLSSENITIKQLFQYIAQAAGSKAPSIYLPDFVLHLLGKVGDYKEAKGGKFIVNSETAWTSTLYHWFKNDKMLNELKIKPRSAQDAIQSSVEWMKENKFI
ncbi:MAG: NAD-dependent epimerase/dehydratase family protein [Bdellovibrionota bacterium]